ncbi:ImmA/IrrE family metallo-endopeptidase [Arcicella rosea]|uniref:Zn-dependent peptidase ImmA (M78 family) n=1 Tax=Arcicella rosea TaxID=502909 RepID=A0A841EK76_9BACT|nr:ImmA/IrrE family metallo-endopeptidase [Arcicella rosea]MBB6001433.1 Zn-dependent peptidase ImmA (M78 family) [Arcicella rosea]
MSSFKQWAENKSLELRLQNGLKSYDYISAQQLANYLGVKIFTPNEIPRMSLDVFDSIKNNWSANTLICGDKYYIIHNNTHSPQRQQSNLMHEMAHIILKHSPEQLISANGLLLRHINEQNEKEAEWLGGCLQLPRQLLFELFRRGESVDNIICKYQVSIEMLRYRTNVTGLKNTFKSIKI